MLKAFAKLYLINLHQCSQPACFAGEIIKILTEQTVNSGHCLQLSVL